MDGDDDLVLLGPEGGALGRQWFLTSGLVEGYFVGGDPSAVLGEELGEGEQGADRFCVDAGTHRFGDENHRAFGDERPILPVMQNHGRPGG